jgi:hypothetical protein
MRLTAADETELIPPPGGAANWRRFNRPPVAVLGKLQTVSGGGVAAENGRPLIW